MGWGGAGELMIEFMYGLAQPQAPGQFAPKQVLGPGGVTALFASWLTAASTLSLIAGAPVFTSITPSAPIDTVMFVPSATSI